MAHNIPRSIRRTMIVVCLCALLTSCASQSTTTSETHTTSVVPVEDLIKQADERYAAREDPTKVREGQTLLREARAAAPDNYDAAWRMARISYVLGDNDSLGKDEREAAFAKARRRAKRRRELCQTSRKAISGSALTSAAMPN
jgi:hypothetical protein